MVKLSFTRIFKMSRIVHIEILFFIYLCCIVNRLTTLHSLALQAGYFDDKEYLFVQAAINFTSANAECKEMGGELVSPKNEIQDRFIRGKIHNSTTEWWTSGHPVSSGDFEWVDGTIFSKEHENWYPGWVNDAGVTGNVQPSMGSSELCVEYRRQYYNDLSELVTVSRYYWNDTGCSSQKFFICQKQKMCGFEYKSDAKCDKEKGFVLFYFLILLIYFSFFA